jgi:hypothetical protein
VDDQEVLAAIGRVVVNASVLEWEVAALVALAEGQASVAAGSERARQIASRTGEAVRQLEVRAKADPGLRPLLQDVRSVLDERHRLAHSIIFVVAKLGDEDFFMFPHGPEDFAGDDEMTVIWNPRINTETRLTLHQLGLHAQALRIAFDRVKQAVTERMPASP